MKYLIVNSGSTAVKYSVYSSGILKKKEIFSRKGTGFSYTEKKFIESVDADFTIFRVVHAKDKTQTRFIDNETYLDIKNAKIFAPLHNGILLELLDFFRIHHDDNKLIAVFDSDFHSQLPSKAFNYPLPKDLTQKYNLRKYGFHGLAFESALEKLREKNGKIEKNIIAVHAGGGVSVCAIKNGISQDTSMGLTPTDGVMMLTRSGSLDPELTRVLEEKENLLPSEVSRILNFESGFYGMTGSKDTKEIIEKAKQGKEPFKSAYELFLYEMKKKIFAYFGVLGSVNLVLLSGGLAYNNEYFADDLYDELIGLGLTKDKFVKVEVDEEGLMLKKAREIIDKI